MADLALPKCHYTHRVQQAAVRLVVEDGLPYRSASWHLRATTGSSSPGQRSKTGPRPREKKSEARVGADYLDRALQNFSGYIAIDELYDGPFCVLSLVDNHTFIRLTYRVLEHDPTQDDIRAFLGDFRPDWRCVACVPASRRTARTSTRCRWPSCSPVSLIRSALSRTQGAYQGRVAHLGQDPQGAEGSDPQAAAWPAEQVPRPGRKATRRLNNGSATCSSTGICSFRKIDGRRGQKTLQRITRGLPHLRTLREIMTEVYRLFDRRCRAATALARLAKLRTRVRRYRWVGRALDKLNTPNLEKALTFLDDKLLPATSNAVERSNRRYRKAQRSVYSVRTAAHIRQPLHSTCNGIGRRRSRTDHEGPASGRRMLGRKNRRITTTRHWARNTGLFCLFSCRCLRNRWISPRHGGWQDALQVAWGYRFRFAGTRRPRS